ncbi:MAG TPA: rRNA pseudouridine synthase [Clostridiales bacterium]|nr:rRNA pseudouridine synthase [Clostridiales bacterium]
MIRLHKYLSNCGVASRRKCENLISQGRVEVNGQIIRKQGVKINPEESIVKVDGRIIVPSQKKVYIMLNKPRGYITSVTDPFGRPTVIDLVKEIKERIVPVGRLDMDTEGLLLLTNDGDIQYKLTHPRHQIYKEYIAVIKGIPTAHKIDMFRRGMVIDGRMTAPAYFSIIKRLHDRTMVRIRLWEGRNRQIRKMCKAIGHDVIQLKRTKIGKLEINGLPLGCWRHLKNGEVKWLQKL